MEMSLRRCSTRHISSDIIFLVSIRYSISSGILRDQSQLCVCYTRLQSSSCLQIQAPPRQHSLNFFPPINLRAVSDFVERGISQPFHCSISIDNKRSLIARFRDFLAVGQMAIAPLKPACPALIMKIGGCLIFVNLGGTSNTGLGDEPSSNMRFSDLYVPTWL